METCGACGRRTFEGRCYVCGWMTPEREREERSRRRKRGLLVLFLLVMVSLLPFLVIPVWPWLALMVYQGLSRTFAAKSKDEFLILLRTVGFMMAAGLASAALCTLSLLPFLVGAMGNPR
jgi:hypothetical protein